MKHSKIAGGSTCKRVIACPASVKLCAQMPPKPSSSYADEGTMLHDAMEKIFGHDIAPRSVIGNTYEGQVLTQELYEEKILPAMLAIDEIDPEGIMQYDVEAHVSFGSKIKGVFGSTDMIGRIGNRAYVIDYKFGDGVPVSAEENEQGMFYAAAAMRTKATQWAFDGADEIEIVIIQPPHVRRWVTTPERIKVFEADLARAVKLSKREDAALNQGSHCRWCAAQPICPQYTGAVDRALSVQLDALDAAHINAYLKNADLLEGWIKSLRELAFNMLENGKELPDWKLVQKQARRKWVDEFAAAKMLAIEGIGPYAPQEVLSPAQAEKALKKVKKELPAELVTSVSSGTTLAPKDDPRPAVLQLGKQLTAALNKLS